MQWQLERLRRALGSGPPANLAREQYSQHCKEKEIAECLVKEFEEYLRL